MQDHGADAANIVAGAAVDFGKGTMKITGALLRQLFLLLLEGGKIKSGETNMNKLMKRLDEGDKLNSVTLKPEQAEQVATLAKKHGLLYAIAETAKGEFIAYYPESQAPRMKNVLEEVLDGKIKDTQEIPPKEKPMSEAEPDVEMPDLEMMEREDFINRVDQTEVLFDAEHPENYIEIKQWEDVPGLETWVHFEGQEPIGPDAKDLADETAKKFAAPHSFEAKGHYSDEKLKAQIGKMAKAYQTEKNYQQELQNREGIMKTILTDKAPLGGAVHFFVDSQNPDNRIAVQKELVMEKGQTKTETRTAIYLNGEKADVDPVETLKSFEKYKATERHGAAAKTEFEMMEESTTLSWRPQEKEKTSQQDFGLDGEQTEILFDVEHPENYIEIRQYQEGDEKTCAVLLHEQGKAPVQTTAELASRTMQNYGEMQDFNIKGHYPPEKLEIQIGKMAKAYQAEKTTREDLNNREATIKTLLKDNAPLEGTVHLITDPKNPNNRIAIKKELKMEKGSAVTETRTAVYLNGRHVPMDPAKAIREFSKIRTSERYGKAAKEEFERMEMATELDWSPEKKSQEKKPLSEYIKEIDAIKAAEAHAQEQGKEQQQEKTAEQRER